MDGSVHAGPGAQYRRDGNDEREKNFYIVMETSTTLLRWSEAGAASSAERIRLKRTDWKMRID
jgi:hypothetical protein